MSKAPSEKSRSPVGVILTAAAFLLLAVILLLESRAIITLHRDYADLASHEISGDEVSILAVAVLIATYLFGMMFETGLFSPETVDSFDYLTEIDATVFDDDFAGEIRFDEEKNVMVLNGAEYPPEPMPNPEHFTGTKRTAAIALEVLNPYSAIGLPLIVHETGLAVPPLVLVLYGIKALLWILLPAAFRSRRRERA